jgi:hypothetical protein
VHESELRKSLPVPSTIIQSCWKIGSSKVWESITALRYDPGKPWRRGCQWATVGIFMVATRANAGASGTGRDGPCEEYGHAPLQGTLLQNHFQLQRVPHSD